MKETLIYARYNQAGNKAIFNILNDMSNEEREKNRGSYYGSLSGLLRHVLGGTKFFLGMYKGALGEGDAFRALSAADSVPFPAEGELSESQWKEFGPALEAVDAAYINMAEALTEADLSCPVKIDWYGGNPESVPLSFMLSQLVVHNTHHRGQISQILDSLKIDNDYSGIGAEFL
ncbi:MAG: damage-inducible protein DinB [Treponema sp.]|jgi:uncharacterized damage-inducible protein DinB|nr:damage-inducible protein DinB [Treponema sp.]